MPVNKRPEPPSTEELIEIVHRYYPRWDRERETVDEYLVRVDSSPEITALKAVVAVALENRAEWRAFVNNVSAAIPGYSARDLTPPSYVMPSNKLLIEYRHPPGSTKFKAIEYRLSHLAPVYDYYETHQHKNGRYLLRTFEPSPEARPIADVVERMITERFGYHRLDPRAGRIVLPHIAVGNLNPGAVTLADALFEDDSRRR